MTTKLNVVSDQADEDALTNLNDFFAFHEKRAFGIAVVSLRHREDALDVVQDAMIRLVERYADKPHTEWAPLFYRIVRNAIVDKQRQRIRRGRWHGEMKDDDYLSADHDPAAAPTPLRAAIGNESLEALAAALETLPRRQREAFLLRMMNGCDVATTAKAMGCSQGSVKTHYSRALSALRKKLTEQLGDDSIFAEEAQ
ncbi:MAG: RNA polymerase sigma factor [Gammaproteobacteria bacterium]|nr:RNA polymerase sigma factor [Gammaproteobacteria bacterium]